MENTLKQFIQTDDQILLAVSGGVDSMVLLALMQQLAAPFAVAHVDHALREESKIEAQYLKEYCQKHQIPFYFKKWQETPESGIEEKARNFRYAFFKEIMGKAGFTKLFTAHHSDDQAETILMRLIRSGSLGSYAGIKACQKFGSGMLLRPLLTFSKKELIAYAEKNRLHYFEDASNQSLYFTRNRLRQEVLPLLKKENPQVLAHFEQFGRQIDWAQSLIEEQLAADLEVVKEKNGNFSFSIEFIQTKSTAYRYYWLELFFKHFAQDLMINQRQILEILNLLEHGQSQWSVDLAKNWQFKRSYTELLLAKKLMISMDKTYTFDYGEHFFLNDHEWLALLPIDAEIPDLDQTKDWQTCQWRVNSRLLSPFTLRKRQPGDRIKLTKTLQKKVSRYFIDQKIPHEQREKSWILTDNAGEILALLPFKNSYLSISRETDKIHYRLLYKYRT